MTDLPRGQNCVLSKKSALFLFDMASTITGVNDLKQVQRLILEYGNKLKQCQLTKQQFFKIKADYEALIQRLDTLPDKVAHEVMVPLGEMAFMPGKIVHTNEIMVLLGDNWFVERSAKQATDIARRRIKSCQDTLDKLNEEEQQLDNWMTYSNECREGKDLVEIAELYDPVEELKWREQHRESVARQKKTDALNRESKKIQKEEVESVTEQVAELALAGESNKVQNEGVEHVTQQVAKQLKSEQSSKSIRWKDPKNEPARIVFSHTDPPSIATETETASSDEIKSPTDIYKHFGVTRRKSILKPSTDVFPMTNEPVKLAEPVPNFTKRLKISSLKAFTGEVVEKKADDAVEENPAQTGTRTRPVSQFKAKRQKNNKPTQ